MIKADIVIDTRRASKDGYPVKIQIYSGRKYKFISLKTYQKSKRLKITPGLARRISELEDEVNFCNNNNLSLEQSIDVIKNGVKDKDLEIFLLKKRIAELQKESGIGMIEFISTRIRELKDLGRSTEAYERTKKQLEYYLGTDDVLINDIDYEWLQKFIVYKTKHGKGKGNVPFLLSTMRSTYKEAQRRESLNIKRDNPFMGLISNKRSAEVTSLVPEEIKKLLNYTPKTYTTKKSKFTTKRHIKLFLLQFLLGGQDYADLASLKWSQIKNRRIKFKRFKNRNKPDGGSVIDCYLFDEALEIIEEYGNKETERVFSHIPHPLEKSYRLKRQNAQQSLERVSDTLGFSEKIKTKTPRYLFRSFAGEILIDTLVAMQIQGHKPQGVTFKYQRQLPYSVIDKEHRKVIDLIFK
ncbi:phage integrase SAM-like domain-containing protein [Aquimarina hainanensis]|uniref:Phage integrase SAM-like domain-containing protein n=1 Tax=Aquimarina hainanensis TaxID=1578017 RepID=A0ABW5N4G5_9FLAO